MKRTRKIVMVSIIAVMAFCLVGCGNSEVKEALQGEYFFCDKDVNTPLNTLTFNEDSVTLETKETFDSQEPETFEGTYKIDKENITVQVEGKKDIVIPYTLKDGKLTLDEGKYFTAKQIDKELQGTWKNNRGFEGTVASNAWIEFKDGKATYILTTQSVLGSSMYSTSPSQGSYKIKAGLIEIEYETGYGTNQYEYCYSDGNFSLIDGTHGGGCVSVDSMPSGVEALQW